MTRLLHWLNRRRQARAFSKLHRATIRTVDTAPLTPALISEHR